MLQKREIFFISKRKSKLFKQEFLSIILCTVYIMQQQNKWIELVITYNIGN